MSRTRLNDDFARQVLSVVEKIPAGSVATYGQLACMIGRPKNARLVARVLARRILRSFPLSPRCQPRRPHRAPGWSEQADLLRAEGAAFKDETHVDLRQSLWLRAD